jgi:hypothetical protein
MQKSALLCFPHAPSPPLFREKICESRTPFPIVEMFNDSFADGAVNLNVSKARLKQRIIP